MRKAPALAVLSVMIPLFTALPVVTPAAASPRPVAPSITSLPIGGVDDAAVAEVGDESVAASSLARRELPAEEQGAAPRERPALLTDQLDTADFESVGVTWARDGAEADLTVLLRTKVEDGWSDWVALDEAGGSDPAAVRAGTEPYYAGASSGVQVRVDLRSGTLPSDLKVELVDPGDSPADGDLGIAPAAAAVAASAQPKIYSRADWGADERLRGSAPTYMSTVQAAVVHHTAGINDYSAERVPSIIRGDYAYHTKSLGWSDIGYNVLVDRFGRLWEGRAGGLDRAVQGAHAGGFNVNTFGVSALGNYETAAAPDAMVAAIGRVVGWKLATYGRNAKGTVNLTSAGGGTAKYPRGTTVRLPVVMAHRDVGSTACPGKNLFAKMGAIRTRAASVVVAVPVGPSLVSAARAPSTVRAATADKVTVTASVTTNQAWTLEVREPCNGAVIRRYTGNASPGSPISVRWDLRSSAGALVPAGTYGLRLTSTGSTPWSSSVQLTAPSSPQASPSSYGGTGTFVPVTPQRVFDSRSASNGRLSGGASVDVKVAGTAGVPSSGVTAVALSVTNVCSNGNGYLTAWPAGAERPVTSNLNTVSGAARTGLVTPEVGTDGEVSFYSPVATDVIVDVMGYWTTSAAGKGFTSVAPRRLYDSRDDARGPLVAGQGRSVPVPTLQGVPASAMTSAVLNVTVTKPSGGGYLVVHRVGIPTPTTTSLSYASGDTIAGRVITGLADGRFGLRASTGTHVVVDLVGFTSTRLPGMELHSIEPKRLLDTRPNANPIVTGVTRSVGVAGRGGVPADAKAVAITVTSVNATTGGHVTVWEAGTPRGQTSDLNLAAGDTRANLTIVPVGVGNAVAVALAGGGRSDLLVDVVGYYR